MLWRCSHFAVAAVSALPWRMRECGDHTLAFGRRQLRIERLALGEQMGMRIDQPRHHDFAGAVKIVVIRLGYWFPMLRCSLFDTSVGSTTIVVLR